MLKLFRFSSSIVYALTLIMGVVVTVVFPGLLIMAWGWVPTLVIDPVMIGLLNNIEFNVGSL